MKGASRKSCLCPTCRRHGGGCLADANRQHKFRDPMSVKEKPMKRQRKGKRRGPREVTTNTNGVLKVIERRGTQVLLEYPNGERITRHMKDGQVILSKNKSFVAVLDGETLEQQVDESTGLGVVEEILDITKWEVPHE